MSCFFLPLANPSITLTLPSEYHPFKNIYNKKGKLIKRIPNPNYNEVNPKEASKVLSKMFKSIMDEGVYKSIPKDDRLF